MWVEGDCFRSRPGINIRWLLSVCSGPKRNRSTLKGVLCLKTSAQGLVVNIHSLAGINGKVRPKHALRRSISRFTTGFGLRGVTYYEYIIVPGNDATRTRNVQRLGKRRGSGHLLFFIFIRRFLDANPSNPTLPRNQDTFHHLLLGQSALNWRILKRWMRTFIIIITIHFLRWRFTEANSLGKAQINVRKISIKLPVFRLITKNFGRERFIYICIPARQFKNFIDILLFRIINVSKIISGSSRSQYLLIFNARCCRCRNR
mmetsp:Transcript_12539/g.34492  ORF Transcript_12539/g.34492 Transcript_12539/m.34492 type:complete len:260 (-) Transcript_12539:157-936(-)